MTGERGPTGDHGQDGRDGRDGRPGDRGPAGEPTPLDKMRVQRGDRRLLVLYLVGILLLIWVGVSQVRSNHDRVHFQRVSVANCNDNRTNQINFNAFIDRLATTYRISRVLNENEKQQRIEAIIPAKGKVPTCPSIR